MARRLPGDLLDGLTHISIDELSYRRHHEYVTVVTDLKRNRIVWVAPGKSADTVRSFFDALGVERSALLELVAIEMSGAYIEAVQEKAPRARLVFDRFHVQRLAHDALDKVRREQVRHLREVDPDAAKTLKRTRFALQKNPWNLTQPETERLARVQQRNRPLYRAYLLKETLCDILDHRQPNVARQRLVDWCSWATRSRPRTVSESSGYRPGAHRGHRRLRANAVDDGHQRGPQRQDPDDHSQELRLPRRDRPHCAHFPLLRWDPDRSAATAAATSAAPALAGVDATPPLAMNSHAVHPLNDEESLKE